MQVLATLQAARMGGALFPRASASGLGPGLRSLDPLGRRQSPVSLAGPTCAQQMREDANASPLSARLFLADALGGEIDNPEKRSHGLWKHSPADKPQCVRPTQRVGFLKGTDPKRAGRCHSPVGDRFPHWRKSLPNWGEEFPDWGEACPTGERSSPTGEGLAQLGRGFSPLGRRLPNWGEEIPGGLPTLIPGRRPSASALGWDLPARWADGEVFRQHRC